MRTRKVLHTTCLLLVISMLGAFHEAAATTYRDSLKQELKQAPRDSTKVGIYMNLAEALWRKDQQQAKQYLEEGLSLAREIDYLKGRCMANNNLGNIYYDLGAYQKALDYYLKALELYKQGDDTLGLSTAYGNIAMINEQQGKTKAALRYELKSYRLAKRKNYKWGLLANYHALGKLYDKLDQPRKGLNHLSKGAALAKSTDQFNADRALVTIYSSMSTIYKNQGHLDSALRYLEKSQQVARSSGYDYEVGAGLIQKGGLYLAMNEPGKAIRSLHKGLPEVKAQGVKDEVKQAYYYLSKAYVQQNNFEKAYQYHRHYSDLKDSLLNERKVQQLTEMQAKYESEQKEKQLALQRARLQRSRFMNYGLIGGLAALFLIGGVITFYLFKRQQAAQKWPVRTK